MEATAEALTQEEVLRRCRRRAARLAGVYCRIYWAMAKEVRARHRQYVWHLARSPLEAEQPSAPLEVSSRRRSGSHQSRHWCQGAPDLGVRAEGGMKSSLRSRQEPRRVSNGVIIGAMLLSLCVLSFVKARYCATPLGKAEDQLEEQMNASIRMQPEESS
ncbi:hypothetical protein ZEAMMB73_Zm00001d011057 [Zea mays]|uniref:Uncharacterized protein n=1 Tax=Zea mays TaxID=4577 RepID=A0A1D6FVN6_MAIZE|nr:hypothetical protein ZEAMMB73_Zm00001d011057 [Zea mays]